IEALQDKPVGIVSMGATLHHYLGAESHLRDILAWFGALTAPTAVYLSSADFEHGAITNEAATRLDDLVAALERLALAAAPGPFGPLPLAARRS
ncbi:MAG TPA: NAD(P)H-dependent oxidoreductase, partial [Tepidiformaceae bacterium]|nr:NAD(P)H-dependent oxidoreductase [Tepidiformaceae bacterium]